MIFGTKTINRLLALVLLLSAPAAVAAEWDLDALMQALAAAEHGERAFVEERELAILEHSMILRGYLRFESATRFEKVVEEPWPERYRIDGDELTVQRGKGEPHRLQLAEHPALLGFIGALRDTLAGDRAGLASHFHLELRGNAEQWELRLTPRDRRLGWHIERLTITGTDGDIATLTVEETGGDRSVLRLAASDA